MCLHQWEAYGWDTLIFSGEWLVIYLRPILIPVISLCICDINSIISLWLDKSQATKIFLFNFNANEKNKNQTTINSILEILLNKNFSREDSLLAIGGGITGDISGFAASLFKRGLHFVNIPTTLLAQVDSSIGGKTGVNSKYGKNLIGSFYQPKLVISDIDTLKTLNRREIVCGYGEILKHSIISKKKFFKYLDQNFDNIIKLKSPYIEKAIFESCKIKKNIVQKDEKEIKKIIKDAMTSISSSEHHMFSIPLEVSISSGNNWGEAK